jgi:hypothetical protein
MRKKVSSLFAYKGRGFKPIFVRPSGSAIAHGENP